MSNETKIVMHECFGFKCKHCEAINICDLDNYETLYICDNCDKQVTLTPDEFDKDGIMVNINDFVIKQTDEIRIINKYMTLFLNEKEEFEKSIPPLNTITPQHQEALIVKSNYLNHRISTLLDIKDMIDPEQERDNHE